MRIRQMAHGRLPDQRGVLSAFGTFPGHAPAGPPSIREKPFADFQSTPSLLIRLPSACPVPNVRKETHRESAPVFGSNEAGACGGFAWARALAGRSRRPTLGGWRAEQGRGRARAARRAREKEEGCENGQLSG